MNIGTWNLKGIPTKHKAALDEIDDLRCRYILAFTETKKNGKGSEKLDECKHRCR